MISIHVAIVCYFPLPKATKKHVLLLERDMNFYLILLRNSATLLTQYLEYVTSILSPKECVLDKYLHPKIKLTLTLFLVRATGLL